MKDRRVEPEAPILADRLQRGAPVEPEAPIPADRLQRGAPIEPGAPPPRRQWQVEFPYRWDLDEIVARRELLRLAVTTSGALFASAVALALFGLAPRGKAAGATVPILRATDLKEGDAHYFRYPGPEDQAVLIHLAGGNFVAYSQRCTHLSCAVMYQREKGRLYCPCHDGVFDPRSGEPTAGPPRRRLQQIALQRQGEMIVAAGIEP